MMKCETNKLKGYKTKTSAGDGLKYFINRMGFKDNYNYITRECDECGKNHVTVLFTKGVTSGMVNTFTSAGFLVGVEKEEVS